VVANQVTSALLLVTGASAWVGSHFNMDDARMLDVGECQYEVWANCFTGGTNEPVTGLHIGTACRRSVPSNSASTSIGMRSFPSYKSHRHTDL